ncbi:MAG: hypothetical protein ACYCUD_12480 [Candidatus Dormibacteria bacterium]
MTLSLVSNGRSISVALGTRIRVMLDGSPGLPWRHVVTSNSIVLRHVPDQLMITIARGSVVTDFLVVAPGTAIISATQSPTCLNSTPPCAMPSRLFSVKVDAKSA